MRRTLRRPAEVTATTATTAGDGIAPTALTAGARRPVFGSTKRFGGACSASSGQAAAAAAFGALAKASNRRCATASCGRTSATTTATVVPAPTAPTAAASDEDPVCECVPAPSEIRGTPAVAASRAVMSEAAVSTTVEPAMEWRTEIAPTTNIEKERFSRCDGNRCCHSPAETALRVAETGNGPPLGSERIDGDLEYVVRHHPRLLTAATSERHRLIIRRRGRRRSERARAPHRDACRNQDNS